MWELVCHHSYKWQGIATDLSLYDSHGVVQGLTDNDFAPDGATPGSGAWRFRPNSRVAIAINPGWRPLVGLRVECIARLPAPASHRQILIEAHKSFRLFTQDRYLFGAFHGDPAVYPQIDWDIISTYKDGLQVPGYRLPLNQWVHLMFEHDGLTRMRLSVDGAVVTSPRGVLSGVPGVGPKGICIGNSVVDGDQPFPGDIDEIKVWRLDPRRYRNQFQDRPLDQETADCWARHVQSLRAAFAENPDCAKQLTGAISAAIDRWLRAIVAQGPETRQRFDDTRAEYAKLWRAGKVDGPQMRKLLRDWCAWLRLVGIDPDGDEQAQSLRQSECWKLVQKQLAGVDCDPQAVALMRLFEQECGCTAQALGERPGSSRHGEPRSTHVR